MVLLNVFLIHTSLFVVIFFKFCLFQDDTAKADGFVTEILSRINYSTNAENAVSNKCDLVIEAIVEKIKIKQKLFTSLDLV